MKLSLYKNHFLVMQTNYFLQKNKINKIRLPSLTRYLYSARIFPTAFFFNFCKLEQEEVLCLQGTSVVMQSVFGKELVTKTVAMILEVRR